MYRRFAVISCVVSIGCAAAQPPVSSESPAPPAQAKPAVDVVFAGKVQFVEGANPVLKSISFVDGGRSLFVGYAARLVDIDAATLHERATLELSSEQKADPAGLPGDYLTWQVTDAVWTWDAQENGLSGAVMLAAKGAAHTGMARWAPGSEMLPTPILNRSAYPCELLAISPNGSMIAVRVGTQAHPTCDGSTSALQVFAVKTGEEVTPPIDVGGPDRAVFSPDGRYVAAGSKSLHIYDLKERRSLEPIATPGLQWIAFHPSEPVVAWSEQPERVHVYNLASRRRQQAEIGGVMAAFSPDGRFLVTASSREVSLLDATTLERVAPPLRELSGRGLMYPGIAFSEDSHLLAVAPGGDEIGVWRLGAPRAAQGAGTGWFARLRRLPIPASPPSPPFARDGEFAGTVTANGQPVAGAEITLRPSRREYADARALPPISMRTGADGRYRFAKLPRIVWDVALLAPGMLGAGGSLEMREAARNQVDFKLEPAATIVGTVVGPDGRAARDVRLFHYHYDGSLELDVAAGHDGKFVIDHLRPRDSYVLLARRADGAVRTATVDISKVGRTKLTVKLLAADDPSVLRAVVVDRKGAPVAGRKIVINSMQSVPTDAQGRFSIDVLGGGPRALLSVLGSGGTDSLYVDLPQAAPLTIPVDLD